MIVAGFGLTSRATLDSLRDALARTGGIPDALATAADKAEGLAPLAATLKLPLYAVPSDSLTGQPTWTHSVRSLQERGTGSVAEAAALAVAGPGAILLAPRAVSTDRMATCALAERKTP